MFTVSSTNARSQQDCRLVGDSKLANSLPVEFPLASSDDASAQPRNITSSIVHLSVGQFARSHLLYYLDLLMNEQKIDDCGVIGVGMRIQDEKMSNALKKQNGFYSLTTKPTQVNFRPSEDVPQSSPSPDSAASVAPDAAVATLPPKVRIVSCLTQYLFHPHEPAQVLAYLISPSTRIASMTITENGYICDYEKDETLKNDLAIKFPSSFDAASSKLDANVIPKSTWGLLSFALYLRYLLGVPYFTVLSCDNVSHNGDIAKQCVLQFVRSLPDFASKSAFIESLTSKLHSPCSMVDRITPVTSNDDKQVLATKYGINDEAPVVCEEFMQWVIDDKFGELGRPPFEKLRESPATANTNIILTSNVDPYEMMKLRLLNATHTSICYLGFLNGLPTIDKVLDNAFIYRHAQQHIDEATTTLESLPEIDFSKYKVDVLNRFHNQNIRDTTTRICSDGATKIKKFVMPIVHERLRQKASINSLSLTVASWILFLSKIKTDDKLCAEYYDPLANKLQWRSKILNLDVNDAKKAILNETEIFDNLASDATFVGAVDSALSLIQSTLSS